MDTMANGRLGSDRHGRCGSEEMGSIYTGVKRNAAVGGSYRGLHLAGRIKHSNFHSTRSDELFINQQIRLRLVIG